MSITFESHLDHIQKALSDGGTTWSRSDTVIPWAIEAIRNFPILRPMLDDHTNGLTPAYSFALPADFREVISVEYPISQQPLAYLTRKNRLDSKFYNADGYFDIDQDYASGSGWLIYFSGAISASAHVKTQYLATHDTAMVDGDSECFLSVPDEYESILIAAVVMRAFRERLSKAMQDPTAHTNIIYQLTEMVRKAEEQYRKLVEEAQRQLVNSRVSPRLASDKFDRVY